MTADDYMAWANEYRQDAEAAEHLYYKYKVKLKEHMGSMERTRLLGQITMYYEQMIKCHAIAKDMEQRAEQIRKKENN